MTTPENLQTTSNPDREPGGCCGPSPCWANINDSQPEDFQEVLFACKGGPVRSGMYFPAHMLQAEGRAYYGKYGRRCEPAKMGYIVTHWMPLPLPPNGD